MDEEVDWIEEYNGPFSFSSGTKRKAKSKKMVFLGWGSKPLIEFLIAIGQDTSQLISRYDVADIITKYVNDNNLLNPTKKKRIVCDEWLRSIFGKKSISRIKIYDLLEPHYTENQDDSDDDFLFSSDDENGGNEQQKIVLSGKKTPTKKRAVETPKSCFAAIIPENIKLVYLKKSLVQKLLEDPVNFERKVVGTFVRVKADPDDYLQKLPYQIVQVKGVKEMLGTDDKSSEILFEVSHIVKDIPMSALSEDNFSKEECDDLHQKVKDGLFKRLTVMELEEKTLMLHEDITKHWLVTEIALLQKRIDRANEKGWRRELVEYLERKQVLQCPDEQARILKEVPKVIAEELEGEALPEDKPADETEWEDVPEDKPADEAETEAVVRDKPDKKKQVKDASRASIIRGASEFFIPSAGNMISFGSVNTMSQGIHDASPEPTRQTIIDNWIFNPVQQSSKPSIVMNSASNIVTMLPVKKKENEATQPIPDREVIDLSDDEEDQTTENQGVVADLHSLLWHYKDPSGNTQGPFSVLSLKRWWDAEYFPLDFTVWKIGQSPSQAIFLQTLLHSVFSN